jgi:hypothetical protein
LLDPFTVALMTDAVLPSQPLLPGPQCPGPHQTSKSPATSRASLTLRGESPGSSIRDDISLSQSSQLEVFAEDAHPLMPDLPPILPTNKAPSVSTSNIPKTFQAACDEYEKITGYDLHAHPFTTELDNCNTPDGILDLVRIQVQTVIKCRTDHEKLLAYLNRMVNMLFTFSATLGQAVRLVGFFTPSAPLGMNTYLSHFLPVRQYLLVSALFSRYVSHDS